jgi:hypothetical protein
VDCAGSETTVPHSSQTPANTPLAKPTPSLNGTSLRANVVATIFSHLLQIALLLSPATNDVMLELHGFIKVEVGRSLCAIDWVRKTLDKNGKTRRSGLS